MLRANMNVPIGWEHLNASRTVMDYGRSAREHWGFLYRKGHAPFIVRRPSLAVAATAK
jgi:hypothetical protein